MLHLCPINDVKSTLASNRSSSNGKSSSTKSTSKLQEASSKTQAPAGSSFSCFS